MTTRGNRPARVAGGDTAVTLNAMDAWSLMTGLLGLLVAALVLGAIAERLRQSAVLGYLLAGMLLGPHTLNLVDNDEGMRLIAEIGVAMLLFTIGLEFSFRELRRIGPIGAVGGSLQVVVTMLLAAGICLLLGVAWQASLALGAMIAMTSTSTILAVLTSRGEVDSVFGRVTLGMSLLQDMAVVPLVLMISLLGGVGSASEAALHIGQTLAVFGALVGAFYFASNWILPRLMNTAALHRNRELPLMLSVTLAIGSAWVAVHMGISPAIGAFIAGVLLAESPYAMQVRTDVKALRTLLMTLFFVSIGMLGNPRWMAENALVLGAVAAAIIVGKAMVVAPIALAFRHTVGNAVAVSLCMVPIGEFSFVLAGEALRLGVINDPAFRLFISATIVTLFVSPLLVTQAPRWGHWMEKRLRKLRWGSTEQWQRQSPPILANHVVVIGFGPAGQNVVRAVQRRGVPVIIAELNPATAAQAQRNGLNVHIGDATQPEMLEFLGVTKARGAVITLPDYRAVVQITQQIRRLAPNTPIIARSRYHLFTADIQRAGAHIVVDEEHQIGHRLAVAVRQWMKARPAPTPSSTPAPPEENKKGDDSRESSPGGKRETPS